MGETMSTDEAAIEYPMKPTDAQWDQLVESFPALNRNDVWVTAPEDPNYNCLAWTLGNTKNWVWPWRYSPVSESDFNIFYDSQGFRPWRSPLVPKIGGWGKTVKQMTHGSVKYDGGKLARPDLWESKLGGYLRITHAERGLEGALYGSLLINYSPKVSDLPRGRKEMEEFNLRTSELNANEKEQIQKEATRIPSDLRRDFETIYSDWEHSWTKGPIAFSSDPKARRATPEFSTLLSMGHAVIPLVVDKLAQPGNFFALQLYDELQMKYGDSRMVVSYELDDPSVLEGEQGRCARTVRRWLDSR